MEPTDHYTLAARKRGEKEAKATEGPGMVAWFARRGSGSGKQEFPTPHLSARGGGETESSQGKKGW